MSEKEANWQYADAIVVEDEQIALARQNSLELGIDPVSPGVGAQLALTSAMLGARSMVEIGTGVGVSGMWLLSGAPTASLTTIDVEADHLQAARLAFADAGYAGNRVRFIAGQALQVLPRMNEESYDVVFIDADPARVIEYVEHGLRLVRRGGAVLVARALWQGRVANPTKRDEVATGYRTLLEEISTSTAVFAALSPVGEGLLQLVRR